MNTKNMSDIAIVIRMKLQNTVGKQIRTLAGIRRKLLIGKAGYFLRKLKKNIYSLKNPYHINKISYLFPEIWLPNLRSFLVTCLCHTARY